MSRLPRLGLRTRLIIAFIGVALLTVYLATLFSTLGVSSRIDEAAHARLVHSGTHFSQVAATVYGQSGGWTPAALTTLQHLAMMDSLRLTLSDAEGSILVQAPADPPVESGATATAPVSADGTVVGTVVVAPASGLLLSAEEMQLRHELDHLHMVAGAASVGVALVVALYLAFTLARPLRTIRATADRVAGGDLAARVDLRGDDEVRAVGKALNDLAETLEREEELRKENLADLAHELRTPVMGMLGRIEAAQDGVMDDEAANLAAMHDETLRLSRLLDDLSALAEAQRPGLLIAKQRVDLAAAVQTQCDVMAERFTAQELSLELELQPAWVDGDPDRLRQVIANLLDNALRYTESGGSVTVSVGPHEGRARLRVADTGIGIDRDDLPFVFTRFWRGERSRSRSTGGAGIGLAIAQELVRAHGGHIEVASEPGKGSLFTVSLPLAGAPLSGAGA